MPTTCRTDSTTPGPWAERLARSCPLLTVVLAIAIASPLLPSCSAPRGADSPGTRVGARQAPEHPPIVRVRLESHVAGGAHVATTGGYELLVDGRLVGKYSSHLDAVAQRQDGRWLIGGQTFSGQEVAISPSRGCLVKLGGKGYCGRLHLVACGANALAVVNHVPMPDYLAGLLTKELYSGWHMETFKAQAIAARTYAYYQMLTIGRGRYYDLGSSAAHQVYGGASAETSQARRAVAETRGLVLTARQDGKDKVFLAQYSACNGGYVNPAYVLRNAPRYGVFSGGQPDPFGRACPKWRWRTVRIAKADVLRAVAASFPKAGSLDRLRTIEVIEQTDYGRAIWIDLVGANGKRIKIRAEDLRLSLVRKRSEIPAAGGLYSMNCRIVDAGGAIDFADGRGYGHGVGMSQWGAQEQACQGWPAQRILAFYYPGAKLAPIY